MNVEDIRSLCLSKPNVEEAFPFGGDVVVYKTNNKIFLLMRLDQDPLSFNVKCDPDKAIYLREMYDCVTPGYHMNKKHWNTIIVDGSVSPKNIKEWIDDSFNLLSVNKKRF